MPETWKQEKTSDVEARLGWTQRYYLETPDRAFSVTTGTRDGRPIMAINITNTKNYSYLSVGHDGRAIGGAGRTEGLRVPTHLFGELIKDHLDGLPDEVATALRAMPHPTSGLP